MRATERTATVTLRSRRPAPPRAHGAAAAREPDRGRSRPVPCAATYYGRHGSDLRGKVYPLLATQGRAPAPYRLAGPAALAVAANPLPFRAMPDGAAACRSVACHVSARTAFSLRSPHAAPRALR